MTRPIAHAASLCVAATIAIGAAALLLDLTPQVDPDFFFAEDDPQIQITNTIERRFPSSTQIIVRAEGQDIESASYRQHVRALATDLGRVESVNSVRSILNTPNYRDPLWEPLLVSRSGTASYLLLDVTPANPSRLTDQLHDAVRPHVGSDFTITISGVPYVLELIRRSLMRDLIVFSAAAMVVFGVAIIAVYRRFWIAIGTLFTTVTAAVATLSVLQLAGVTIGLLTANLVTIVFVLTLSHVVFLTSNWRLAQRDAPPETDNALLVRATVRRTLEPSFWCMATTTLGFVSLLLARAQPLRQLGVAGATGTLVAIVIAYLVYPVFLRASTPLHLPADLSTRWLPSRRRWMWLAAFGVATLAFAGGVMRLSTDPSLLSYFATDSDIRRGLEQIDHDGGSSPLRLVVRDSENKPFDTGDGFSRLRAAHEDLRDDPDVGSVVSPSILLAEIQRSPLAANRPVQEVLDIPIVAPIVAPFFSQDRTQAHLMLRMRESGRTTSRTGVIDRIEQRIRRLDMEPVLVGGLYDLQAQLARLLASSLRYTLIGLIVLFTGIGWFLTRSIRTAAALTVCLAVIPVVILGGFGYTGIAVDIISSPASNVALAMGVDSMIHLVVRARTSRAAGHEMPWREARLQLWHPILGATLIISAGFGIFGLSVFPPTARFGLAVIVGTATAAAMSLVAMPMLAGGGEMEDERRVRTSYPSPLSRLP